MNLTDSKVKNVDNNYFLNQNSILIPVPNLYKTAILTRKFLFNAAYRENNMAFLQAIMTMMLFLLQKSFYF